MSAAARWESERRGIDRFVLLAIGGMTLCLFVYAVNHYREEMATTERIAREIALAAFEKDVSYRRWNAMHGGVYVPVTPRTLPNPWLTIPEREITTLSGRLLTKVNPAYMTRQVYEMMLDRPDALIGHLTSLRPLRPENAPAPWEREALSLFEKGVKEFGRIEVVEGKHLYRFMRPFVTEKPCLSCHAQHGYREGDIRGGISITVPMDRLENSAWTQVSRDIVFSLFLWGAGCGIILNFRRRLLASLAETERGWEEAIRREQTYRTLFESTHAVMLLVDGEGGRIIRGNPAASRFYGYREEEFPHLLITDINISPPEQVWELLRRVRNREVGTFVTSHRTKGGEIRTVEVRSTPLESAEGVILHSIVIDITDRIEAERQAEENLRLAWSLVGQMSAPAYVIDPTHRVVVWNQAMEELTGISATELLGTSDHWRVFNHLPGPTLADTVADACLPGVLPETRTVQKEIVLKGKRRTLQMSAAPIIDHQGTLRGVIETIIDLTQTLQMQEQLIATQKMETLGLLASGVAHDLNNILTVISGYAAMIASTLSDPTIQHQLEEILKGVERASAMTRNILAFSGKRKSEKQVIDLVPVVTGIEKMLRRLIPEGISLTRHSTPAHLPVHADRTQIEQAVMNLVINARDAIGDRGSIRLILEEAIHSGDETLPAGRYGVIRVEDDGEGILPDMIDRIFEPFVSTKGSRGTGLGLSIVRDIVRSHGGGVAVESTPGSGSRFSLFFPLLEPGAFPQPTPVETPLFYDGEGTILLVEDDPPTREMISASLTRHGYVVHASVSAQEGWSLYAESPERFSAIVTDLVTSDGNGADLVRRVRGISPHIPCIVISGYHHDLISQEEMMSLRVDYLPKPFTPLQLLSILRERLSV